MFVGQTNGPLMKDSNKTGKKIPNIIIRKDTTTKMGSMMGSMMESMTMEK